MKSILRRSAVTCLALFVLYFVVPVHPEERFPLGWRIALSLAALAAVIVAIKRQLLRQLDEPEAPLGGLLAGVVGGLLLFALADYATAVYAPGQFVGLNTRIDALYYAMATLFTVGFGDVAAQGQFARGLVCLQMLFDVVILATTGSVILQQVRTRARAHHTRDR